MKYIQNPNLSSLLRGTGGGGSGRRAEATRNYLQNAPEIQQGNRTILNPAIPTAQAVQGALDNVFGRPPAQSAVPGTLVPDSLVRPVPSSFQRALATGTQGSDGLVPLSEFLRGYDLPEGVPQPMTESQFASLPSNIFSAIDEAITMGQTSVPIPTSSILSRGASVVSRGPSALAAASTTEASVVSAGVNPVTREPLIKQLERERAVRFRPAQNGMLRDTNTGELITSQDSAYRNFTGAELPTYSGGQGPFSRFVENRTGDISNFMGRIRGTRVVSSETKDLSLKYAMDASRPRPFGAGAGGLPEATGEPAGLVNGRFVIPRDPVTQFRPVIQRNVKRRFFDDSTQESSIGTDVPESVIRARLGINDNIGMRASYGGESSYFAPSESTTATTMERVAPADTIASGAGADAEAVVEGTAAEAGTAALGEDLAEVALL